MASLNQYGLSKALGSKMKPVKPVAFGNFALLETVAEVLRTREPVAPIEGGTASFTFDQDRVVAQAFEDVREGAAPDAILWDRTLCRNFKRRCRELGMDAPVALFNRRLINIRKNKKRYAKKGIVLSPTTKSEPHPSIIPEYAHVVEFALVRLRYRYGVSIDDILLDPALSDQYERLARSIAPKLRPMDLRLAALYVRKSRYIKKHERNSIELLDLDEVEHAWTSLVNLGAVHIDDVPPTVGLFELKESRRVLYVASSQNLKGTVAHLLSAHALQIMANGFWMPNPEHIGLQFLAAKTVSGTSIKKWESKLIHDRQPLFNWPISDAA